MPRISEEESATRRDEIVRACESLYEHESFCDITMAKIADHVRFSRANIYNYFQTKEEIFLELLRREYEEWIAELDAIGARSDISDKHLAEAMARTLERRDRLLKLLAMNCYDMEANSRPEHLVAFKRTFGASLRKVDQVIAAARPDWTPERRDHFTYALFPFMFGLYPYTKVTERQRAAMSQAGVDFHYQSIYELSRPFIQGLLQARFNEQ